MSTVTTDRTLNVSQLGVELGRRSVHAIGPYDDGTTVVTVPGVGVANLTAAIEAHTADPGWVDPEATPPEPPAPTLEERIAFLEENLVAQAIIDADALPG